MLRVALGLALAAVAFPAAALAPPQENRANAATAGLPNIQALSSAMGQSDLCLGLNSAGYGSPMLGVTFNASIADAACRRIRTSKQLDGLGLRDAAVQVMCTDTMVREAMKRAGTPCEAQTTGSR